ncbi:MAG: hypothetical protein HY906_20080 [Deltaproteobacteria bacterium]|nr:hypothetical protein [Deltaproteobacteria bacterium]
MAKSGAVATSKDRAHFAAIGAAEAESEEGRIARAAAATPAERLRRGAELSAEAAFSPAHLAAADADADSQMELARRRLALGLGRTPR